MLIFVEMWRAKASWLSLSSEERKQYLAQVGPVVQWLVDSGVEIVSWSLNDLSTSHRADYPYFAIYKFPSKELTTQFEQKVEQTGWYQYFEQINAKGEIDTPQPVIAHFLGLE
jgi:hypothetical protein